MGKKEKKIFFPPTCFICPLNVFHAKDNVNIYFKTEGLRWNTRSEKWIVNLAMCSLYAEEWISDFKKLQ